MYVGKLVFAKVTEHLKLYQPTASRTIHCTGSWSGIKPARNSISARRSHGMTATIKQFSLFGLVGAVGTGAHYALLFFLVSRLAVHPVAASVTGAILGAVINYALNYRFTFRSARRHREAAPRFLAIAAVGLTLNAALMWFFVEPLRLHYLIAQLIATGCVLVWNYLGNRYWTFEKGASCRPRI